MELLSGDALEPYLPGFPRALHMLIYDYWQPFAVKVGDQIYDLGAVPIGKRKRLKQTNQTTQFKHRKHKPYILRTSYKTAQCVGCCGVSVTGSLVTLYTSSSKSFQSFA
jgi:hypothetical protein